MSATLDPEMLLRGYAVGIFPMADSRDAESVYWVEPKKRAILPLERFHLSRSLRKDLRSERLKTTANRAFQQIVSLCAEEVDNRQDTWINAQIEEAVYALHRSGHAHSIETWLDGKLVGGLYGIALGGAFFGESMVSRVTNASKTALAHLVARLKIGGFTLLDCQFMTDHLATLGAIEIKRTHYLKTLHSALVLSGDFGAFDRFDESSVLLPLDTTTVSGPVSGCRIVHALTQMSKMGCSTAFRDGDSL